MTAPARASPRPADAWDWDMLLAGADRLHLSGITPALGPVPAKAAIAAAEAASARGVPISFDGNYRANCGSAGTAIRAAC
jgi:2-dehydro-3-deoxygluconokinase